MSREIVDEQGNFMPRRYISEFTEHENVEQVFLVADKQLRANRQGNLYLQMRLADRSGSITALLWNVSENLAQTFESGDYVQVRAATHIHNGSLQMIVSRIERVPSDLVDRTEFETLDRANVDGMATALAERLRAIHCVPLRNLAECFLMDEAFMTKFTAAPAGVKNHHAYRGGLLEHVLQLLRVVEAVSPLYPELDPDLMRIGAFLHDVGKIDELTYDRELAYSDEGQLLGHLVIGLRIVQEKIVEVERLSGEPFPADLRLQIEHLIVSHHGELEFGSPKVPMTLEATALHFLDNLDAKMHSFGQLLREDLNSESRWTPFHASIGRKLYKKQSHETKS